MSATFTEPEPHAATSPLELEIRRVRDLAKSGQHAPALEAAEALAALHPENRDALYLIALSQRFLGRIAPALATLERLGKAHPAYSRLHQERGHCYVALRDAPRAIDAFLRAVNINPALPQSWSMLEGLYRMTGDRANAATAASHVSALKKLPPQVVRATSLFSDGDLTPAESIVRAFLLEHGDHVEAMRLLAKIGIARGVLDDAELLLDAVLSVAPDYRAARHDHALVLVERHKYARAREELERLLALEPENRQYRTLYATACVGVGEHEKAIPLYRALLEGAPRPADLHLSIAHAQKALGRAAEAVESYRAAAAAQPSFGDAYWSLANLKTYRFLDAEIERMRAAEAAPGTALVDRYHLCFALGKAYEDRGGYAESWRYYERGNELKRSESRYRPEILEGNTRRQIAVCTREFLAGRAGWGAPAADPIFIVGLPRAGSTLIEQILASHSMVEGTQELADVQRIVHELQGRDPDLDDPRYPGVLADLGAGDLLRLGQRYLADTRIYRTDKPRFVDKMPNNFRHIGLIHLILPNARIIDARRDPMACCFSNLKQLFANGQEFTYGIPDIARYYRTYLELMGHWDRVLPGRILRVHHEDVVADLEGSVRRMLEFCGLPFEPSCIEFHKTERSIRTASSEQVRRPIYREGLDQWKHFERWLGPLKDALGDVLESDSRPAVRAS
ncbi:MAG TPA: sulfotransferase [Steroidobacteraceae bacterium]|jgi:tetratricopeptide (TPR) repeat protein|nr:sulfotransferase [Steroidobacteraceae bacterium]